MNLLSAFLAGVALWLLALPAVAAFVRATSRWPLQAVVRPAASAVGLGLAALTLFFACRWLLWLTARYVRRAVEHVPDPPVATQVERATRVAALREVTLAVALLSALVAAAAVWTQGWRPEGTWYLLVLAALFALAAVGRDRALPLTEARVEDGPRLPQAAPPPTEAHWVARVWTWEPEGRLADLARSQCGREVPWRAEALAALEGDDWGSSEPAGAAGDPGGPGPVAAQLAEQIRQTPAGAAVPDQPALLAAIAASVVVQGARRRPEPGVGTVSRARRGRVPGRVVSTSPGAALARGAALDRDQVRDLVAEVLDALGVACEREDEGCTLHLGDGRRAALRIATDARDWRLTVGDAPGGSG